MQSSMTKNKLCVMMKVTTEGPKELTDQQAALIARKWHSLEPNRRIQNLNETDLNLLQCMHMETIKNVE